MKKLGFGLLRFPLKDKQISDDYDWNLLEEMVDHYRSHGTCKERYLSLSSQRSRGVFTHDPSGLEYGKLGYPLCHVFTCSGNLFKRYERYGAT